MNSIKSFLGGAALAVLLLIPAISHAEVTQPTNGNPYTVTNAWGLTGEQSMKYWFPAGGTIVLKNGSVFTCPWFITQGCFDLRWYYNQ